MINKALPGFREPQNQAKPLTAFFITLYETVSPFSNSTASVRGRMPEFRCPMVDSRTWKCASNLRTTSMRDTWRYFTSSLIWIKAYKPGGILSRKKHGKNLLIFLYGVPRQWSRFGKVKKKHWTRWMLSPNVNFWFSDISRDLECENSACACVALVKRSTNRTQPSFADGVLTQAQWTLR